MIFEALNRMTPWLAVLTLAGMTVANATTVQYNATWSPNIIIPDNDANGVVNIQTVATNFRTIGSVTVHLTTSSGWNGDLYIYLQHSSGISILLNRPGRTTLLPDGSDNAGFDITLSDAATADINTDPSGNGQVTGTWQPDGRMVDPAIATSSYARTALLSNFLGNDPNGTWALFMADLGAGEESNLTSWGLTIRAPNSLSLSGGISLFDNDDNAYNGPIDVDSTATLEVSSSGRLTAMTEINLNGGTLLMSGSGSQRINDGAGEAPLRLLSGGKLALNGPSITESFGTLTVTNGGVIDFGTGSGQLIFSDSSALTWTGLLSMWNWDAATDQIKFGNLGTALTQVQLDSIRFYSDGGTTALGSGVMQADGTVVPVPEAASLVAPTVLLLCTISRRRRGSAVTFPPPP